MKQNYIYKTPGKYFNYFSVVLEVCFELLSLFC